VSNGLAVGIIPIKENMNLAKLYILCDTHEENASLYIAEAIEDALQELDFESIDKWLSSIDFDRITKGTAFSFIALTNVAKHNHQFQNRSRFIEECERRWQYSEGLMEKYK
jgi:uncharacterized protein YchJ